MAVTSPITDFTTTANDGDAEQYFSTKDAGYRCAWAMFWATGQTSSATQHAYEFFKPSDWVSVEDLDSTHLDYELTDVEARAVSSEATEATYQLANGTDESKRTFLGKARNNYPSVYWWVNPPPSTYLLRVDKNPTGWTAADYSGSNADIFWDKHKLVRGDDYGNDVI